MQNNNTQNYLLCKKCKDNFIYKQNETFWQESGTYSVKLVKCPFCGTINVIKYIDAAGLNTNIDSRYYK